MDNSIVVRIEVESDGKKHSMVLDIPPDQLANAIIAVCGQAVYDKQHVEILRLQSQIEQLGGIFTDLRDFMWEHMGPPEGWVKAETPKPESVEPEFKEPALG